MTGPLDVYVANGFAIRVGKSSSDSYDQYQASNGQYRLEKGGVPLMEWGPTTHQVFKPLLLPADPTNDLEAATKKYVDSKAGSDGTGAYLPLEGGTMTGTITFPAQKGIVWDAETSVIAYGSRYIKIKAGAVEIEFNGIQPGLTVNVPITTVSPTLPVHVATKDYVDNKPTIVSMAAGGTVPSAASYPNGTLLVEY
jgi:hypothetical protein